MVKKSPVGRGDCKEIIETYIHDQFYVPDNGECFLKCFMKAFQLTNDEKYFEYKEMIPGLYKKFCIEQKVKHDLFPMCKVGKFMDFIQQNINVVVPLYKYDHDKFRL